jgi:hypothetical protein
LRRSATPGKSARVVTWTRHPNWGIEFDWFAVDRDGFVGLFSSAGNGPIPASVAAHASEFDDYDWGTHLPPSGRCLDSPTRAGDFSFWVVAAERGMFGFDWQMWDGPFERLTVPSHPVRATDLPPDMRRLASLAVLSLDFGSTSSLGVEDRSLFAETSDDH